MPVIKYKDSTGTTQTLPLIVPLDPALSTTSTNGVQNRVITNALNTKSTVSVSASGTATDEVQYITIDGVEKKLAGSGGSGEPAAYLKSASTSGNTLTLVNKDNTTVVYTPTEQYTGTVTSVAAGTGLSISGTVTVNPTVNVDSNYKLPTSTEWGNKQNTSDNTLTTTSKTVVGAINEVNGALPTFTVTGETLSID